MKVIKKFKKLSKKYKIISIVAVIAIFAVITILILSSIKTPEKSKTISKKSTLSSEAASVSGSDAQRISASPSSGQLIYEQQETYYSPASKTPKFIYVTSEYRDERLIELNDQVVQDLKDSKQIDDNTRSYSINYFSNKTVANNYFKKIKDSNTSDSDKNILVSGYIAKTTFSQNPKLNLFVKISTAKILKK